MKSSRDGRRQKGLASSPCDFNQPVFLNVVDKWRSRAGGSSGAKRETGPIAGEIQPAILDYGRQVCVKFEWDSTSGSILEIDHAEIVCTVPVDRIRCATAVSRNRQAFEVVRLLRQDCELSGRAVNRRHSKELGVLVAADDYCRIVERHCSVDARRAAKKPADRPRAERYFE